MQPAAAAAAVAPVQASSGPSTSTQPPQQAAGAAAAGAQQGDGIGGAHPIRLSLSERARTVTYVATAATLGTFSTFGSAEQEAAGAGTPFGSYVDYILDDKVRGLACLLACWGWHVMWLVVGCAQWSADLIDLTCVDRPPRSAHNTRQGWPVLLLSEQSLHTQNIKNNPRVSLFVQLPKQGKETSVRCLLRSKHLKSTRPVVVSLIFLSPQPA